jgi:hypothetical protein
MLFPIQILLDDDKLIWFPINILFSALVIFIAVCKPIIIWFVVAISNILLPIEILSLFIVLFPEPRGD